MNRPEPLDSNASGSYEVVFNVLLRPPQYVPKDFRGRCHVLNSGVSLICVQKCETGFGGHVAVFVIDCSYSVFSLGGV